MSCPVFMTRVWDILGEIYDEKNPNGYTVFFCPMCRSVFGLDSEDIQCFKKGLAKEDYLAKRLKPRNK